MENEDIAAQADAVEAAQVDAGQNVQTATDAQETPEKLRKEAASWRRKTRELEAKVAEYEQARLSETKKLQKQAQDAAAAAQAAKEELRKARGDAALAREAAKAGVDPVLLGRLIDIEYDDDGLPVNLSAAVAKVLADYPQLKPAVAQPAQPPNSNPTNPQRVGKLTMDEIKHMSPDEVNARWPDVQAVMKAAGR